MIVRRLSKSPDAIAPDGSEVRILATGERGSMAHFTLPPGKISKAVAHRTVEEVWFIIAGQGRMWRKLGDEELIADLESGISIDIPLGTHFQFRCDGGQALEAVGVTMPPWPGMDEAYEVEGIWKAST
jgi:mannose-6-phosphate isomerase-like protein (cupin superfamily)